MHEIIHPIKGSYVMFMRYIFGFVCCFLSTISFAQSCEVKVEPNHSKWFGAYLGSDIDDVKAYLNCENLLFSYEVPPKLNQENYVKNQFLFVDEDWQPSYSDPSATIAYAFDPAGELFDITISWKSMSDNSFNVLLDFLMEKYGTEPVKFNNAYLFYDKENSETTLLDKVAVSGGVGYRYRLLIQPFFTE